MQASALITRSLRLINVPGQGATLSSTDEATALSALQELLDSKSVSKHYVPGISRHFFTLTGQDVYTYGPGGDLDTDAFEDPVPSKIESAYIRVGGTIVNNEKAANDLFSDNTGWTLGAGWTIQSGQARCSAGLGALSQTITGLTIGVTYDVTIKVASVSAGAADLTIDVINEAISGAGTSTFSFTATATSHALALTPSSAFTAAIDSLSVRAQNTDRTTFEGGGSDYPLRIVDQFTYNRKYTKGAGGRPYELLYTMAHPLGDLRFDNTPAGGEYLFCDVTVNRIGVEELSDELRLHPVAIRWLRYELASELAPEYGKTLKPDAVRNLKDARQNLAAANSRMNHLRVDAALRPRRSYDINRGDP